MPSRRATQPRCTRCTRRRFRRMPRRGWSTPSAPTETIACRWWPRSRERSSAMSCSARSTSKAAKASASRRSPCCRLQDQGIGAALIAAGIAACRELGVRFIVVLGEPRYYRRFGFRPTHLGNEYGVGDEFMALDLEPHATAALHGVVRYGLEFRRRHEHQGQGRAVRRAARGPNAFVIANAWDAGSARILAGLGFQALATSSGAHAGTLGRRDGTVTRDEALAHARPSSTATDLPVSADLEKCFGDEPEAAAETIRLAAEVGLVGGSIEDATGDKAAALRLRPGGRARRGRGRRRRARCRSRSAYRAGGELPARQPGPRRHHQAPAGVREGRRRRADGARACPTSSR